MASTSAFFSEEFQLSCGPLAYALRLANELPLHIYSPGAFHTVIFSLGLEASRNIHKLFKGGMAVFYSTLGLLDIC